MKNISLNQMTSLVALAIMALFTSQGITIDVTPGQVADAIMTKEGFGLIMFLVMNLGTPLWKTIKRISQYGYNWRVLISRNFFIHVAAALSVIVSIMLGKQSAGYITAMLLEAANMAWHYFGAKHTPPEVTGLK